MKHLHCPVHLLGCAGLVNAARAGNVAIANFAGTCLFAGVARPPPGPGPADGHQHAAAQQEQQQQ